jgi:tripartite-type tricarboxylate transporter receptor subunit TctC
VDVINTTLQQIFPCKDSVKILASIGSERISILPDVPTVQEILPDLSMSLWNGLFVHKDVPAEAREKIEAAARAALEKEGAQKLIAQTGVSIYWQNAEESAAQIASDTEVSGRIAEILGE